MSEESKTSDSDYVHMNYGGGPKIASSGGLPVVAGLDDPNLSQEDKDLRLAIALQQQENAAAYAEHKKRHDAALSANTNRTARSNTHTKLAQVRKMDHGMLTVPDEYTTENAYKKGDSTYVNPDKNTIDPMKVANANGALPQEVADLKLALDLQKMEQTGAGTAQTLVKIMKEEKEDVEANDMRNARSKALY